LKSGGNSINDVYRGLQKTFTRAIRGSDAVRSTTTLEHIIIMYNVAQNNNNNNIILGFVVSKFDLPVGGGLEV